ncbi:EAL domain-containing protein [Tianweitania sediminis]|uniref:EAL domain-containing protein n=1 Tax=Tianweitania sediminis TaxID=1502156 RepID=A0A8J7R2H5_9HYPH|nr:EAL domain-containing protein [Tianweitania sediminis]MBP0439045.1 EAL domain-containing protein [Tianweitania sediminis]
MATLQFGNPLFQTDSLQTALSSIRKHLGMEVAYISEFVGDETVYREVDAPGLEALIKVGDKRPLDEVYCRHILAGRLPELISDTSQYELARSMPITAAVPIGAHMSVPIRDRNGTAVGMFCCLSPSPNKTLNERDLQIMRVFADMAAEQISEKSESQRHDATKRAAVESVIAEEAFSIVYQPIWNFLTDRPTGFEALCRFAPQPYRSPDKWLQDAFEVGLGPKLEMCLIKKAVTALARLPENTYLSVNISPETLITHVSEVLEWQIPFDRLIFEITEHAAVDDYVVLLAAVEKIRAVGAGIAIDDAGAGYSGLQHILRLKPEIVKLDMSLTRAVDSDDARQALASALIFFSLKTSCILVAEGIETTSELQTLRCLGVPRGQGYLLGRPAGLDEVLNLLTDGWKLQPTG